MPKVKTFKTNFSIQKSEKETLKEITMLINTSMVNKITPSQKSINFITEFNNKSSVQQRQIQSGVAQSMQWW